MGSGRGAVGGREPGGEERQEGDIPSYGMDRDHGARQVSTRMLQETHGKALPSRDKVSCAEGGDGSPRGR